MVVFRLQENLKKRLNARIQYAKFLQDTVGEMARELKGSRSGELQKKASELDHFMGKVCRSIQNLSQIFTFVKLKFSSPFVDVFGMLMSRELSPEN